jgi:hypothetical protein
MDYLKNSNVPDYIKHFYNDLGLAILDLEEHKRIYTEDDDRIELLNGTAPSFFSRLHRLYWISFTMNIGRYLDGATFRPTQAENISFATLVARSSGLPFEHEIRALEAEAQNLARPFKIVRDKLVAHADLRTIQTDGGYNFELKTSSVERVYDLMERGMNLYFQHFDGQTRGWQKLPPSGGALSLIASLKR